jgi:hypothetical protein
MIDEARHLAQERKYFNQSSWGSVFILSSQLFLLFFFFFSFSFSSGAFKRNGTISEYMREKGGRVEKAERNDKEERTGTRRPEL